MAQPKVVMQTHKKKPLGKRIGEELRKNWSLYLLVSIPVRYMHTSVETVKVSTIENTGELLAHFIDDIAREWEDIQWY